MIKDYSTKEKSYEPMTPSDRTVEFILNYSKSLHVVDLKKNENQIDLNLN